MIQITQLRRIKGNMSQSKLLCLSRLYCWAACLLIICFMLPSGSPVYADEKKEQPGDQAQVMQSFEHQEDVKQSKAMTTEQKHQIMFLLGAPLLVILLITGGLGIAMGVYGKQVFVLHMILAGLAVTLAIVHAIVGLVWFYPF